MAFRSRAAAVFGAAVLGVGVVSAAVQPDTQAAPGACGLQTPDRVVSIADVHGAYDTFVAILRRAGLIDPQNHWAGGRAVFVQTGDVIDRGPDSRRALDLLRALEAEAPKSGGRVVPLLGNHEVMRMTGDLRYTSAGEYAAFKAADSAARREELFQKVLLRVSAQARDLGQPFDPADYRHTFETEVQLGSIEMQIAFSATGEYGKWLRTHDTVAVVNGVAFLHGGLTPDVASLGCAGINAKIRSQLKTAKVTDTNFYDTLIGAEDGPLWYRGLVDTPLDITDDGVTQALRRVGARAIVVGHTVAPGMQQRALFNGRVYQTDTGMLGGEFFAESLGPNGVRHGVPSALEIKGPTFTAIYLDRREVLFTGGRVSGGRPRVPSGAARR